MGIKHVSIASHGSMGLALHWNANHTIDGDVDFGQFQALKLVIEKGTAFPAGPVAGQVFFRTDLGALYVYDGVSWEGYVPPIQKYEFFDAGDDSDAIFYGASWYAQTFTLGVVATNEDIAVNYVMLKLQRQGNPGNLTVSIRAVDALGKPYGPDLATGTIDGNTIPTTVGGTWVKIPLTAATLLAATKYAIVMRCPTGSGGNQLLWSTDSSAPAYAGGSEASSLNSGVTWTLEPTWDGYFEVWGRPA